VAELVNRETSLEAFIVDEGDGNFRVDVAVPQIGDEIRAVVSVDDPDDWEWIRDQYVVPRLSADPP